MSPDQVTRAAPGKSSNVSPGDNIGGIAFWWKEIMHHKQNKVSAQSKSRQAAAMSREEQWRGINGKGSWWQCGSAEEEPCITHTHRMRKKVSFNIRTDATHTRELRRLTHGEEKCLWQSPLHWRMGRRTHHRIVSPPATSNQLFQRKNVHTSLKGEGWNIFWCLWWPKTFSPKVRCPAREKGK